MDVRPPRRGTEHRLETTDPTVACPCGAAAPPGEGLQACPACGGWRLGAAGDAGPVERLAAQALARLPRGAQGARLVDARRLPLAPDPATALAAAAARLGADGLLLAGLLAARGDALERSRIEARLGDAGLELLDLEVDREAGAGAALARLADPGRPRGWLAWIGPAGDLEPVLSAAALVRVALGAPSAAVLAVVPEEAAPFFERCPAVRAVVTYDPARLAADPAHRAAVCAEVARRAPVGLLDATERGAPISPWLAEACPAPLRVIREGSAGAERFATRVPCPGADALERYAAFLAAVGSPGPLELRTWEPAPRRSAAVQPAPPPAPRPRALFSYLPEPCGWPEDDPRLRGHSNKWESRQFALELAAAGFEVDLVDFRDLGFLPRQRYDLVLDIDRNLGRLDPHLPPETLRLVHCTGSWSPWANRTERTRLARLATRRGVRLPAVRQVPDVAAADRSLEVARFASVLGNRHTLTTFPAWLQAKATSLDATGSDLGPNAKGPGELVPPRREFLFYAGAGAVLKGLDLVLEAFDRHPEWILHLAGPAPLEPEFAAAYREALFGRPNTVVHGLLDPAGPDFGRLLRRCFAFVAPSCTEGQATAVLTCMRAGLWPIVSRECGVDLERGAGTVLERLSPEAVEAAAGGALDLPERALRDGLALVQARAVARHGRPAFAAAVRRYLRAALAAPRAAAPPRLRELA